MEITKELKERILDRLSTPYAIVQKDALVFVQGDTIYIPDKNSYNGYKEINFSPSIIYTADVYNGLLAAAYHARDSENFVIVVIDLKTLDTIQTLSGHRDPIGSVKFLSEDSLASCSNDENLKIWNIKTGEHKTAHVRFAKKWCFMQAIAVSHSRKIIACGHNQEILLWDFEGKLLPFEFSTHSDDITLLAFSPDGNYLVSGGNEMNVKLHSIANKSTKAGCRFSFFELLIGDIAVTQENVFVGIEDGTLYVLDKSLNVISSHKCQRSITSVNILDDKALVTTEDGQVLTFDT